ncbi:integrase core domain-containing protein [Candidatus Poriferisodalis sp.]|uniref:integrase core domain-containing protein n=1 Tax=Candidatus Poriferisodalis sp. TaxID=3101277 RepID=UPI003B52F60F
MAALAGLPNRTGSGVWDVTGFGQARRCVFAIVEVVSRYWTASLVSTEETSTQVRVIFDQALLAQDLDELLTEGRLDLDIDDPDRPILVAVSDNGPAMTSPHTRAYMAMTAIAQHPRRPHTPTDQAWIESFFSHITHEWPHLNDITDPALLDTEPARIRIDYNEVRRHETLGYLTPRRRTPPTTRTDPRGPPPRPPTSPHTTARPQPPNHHQQPRQHPMTWFITQPNSAKDSDTPQSLFADHAPPAATSSQEPKVQHPWLPESL